MMINLSVSQTLDTEMREKHNLSNGAWREVLCDVDIGSVQHPAQVKFRISKTKEKQIQKRSGTKKFTADPIVCDISLQSSLITPILYFSVECFASAFKPHSNHTYVTAIFRSSSVPCWIQHRRPFVDSNTDDGTVQ